MIQLAMYNMTRIIGEPYYIWRFTLKMLLTGFKLVVWSTLWEETHGYSLNGVH